MTVYGTKNDVIEYEIKPALGEWACDYDLDAIFDEAFDYDTAHNGIVPVVSGDDFWCVAAAHDVSER